MACGWNMPIFIFVFILFYMCVLPPLLRRVVRIYHRWKTDGIEITFRIDQEKETFNMFHLHENLILITTSFNQYCLRCFWQLSLIIYPTKSVFQPSSQFYLAYLDDL